MKNSFLHIFLLLLLNLLVLQRMWCVMNKCVFGYKIPQFVLQTWIFFFFNFFFLQQKLWNAFGWTRKSLTSEYGGTQLQSRSFSGWGLGETMWGGDQSRGKGKEVVVQMQRVCGAISDKTLGFKKALQLTRKVPSANSIRQVPGTTLSVLQWSRVWVLHPVWKRNGEAMRSASRAGRSGESETWSCFAEGNLLFPFCRLKSLESSQEQQKQTHRAQRV